MLWIESIRGTRTPSGSFAATAGQSYRSARIERRKPACPSSPSSSRGGRPREEDKPSSLPLPLLLRLQEPQNRAAASVAARAVIQAEGAKVVGPSESHCRLGMPQCEIAEQPSVADCPPTSCPIPPGCHIAPSRNRFGFASRRSSRVGSCAVVIAAIFSERLDSGPPYAGAQAL